MTEGLTVREARAGDGEACARLWIEFGRALAHRMPGQFREPEQPGLADWFEVGIAQTGPGVLRAMAEVGGEVVGLAHALIRKPSDPPGVALAVTSLQARVSLEDLVVAEPIRGEGVGTALVRYVQEWGRANGATAMTLSSDADGPARRFYERLGFVIEGAMYGKEL